MSCSDADSQCHALNDAHLCLLRMVVPLPNTIITSKLMFSFCLQFCVCHLDTRTLVIDSFDAPMSSLVPVTILVADSTVVCMQRQSFSIPGLVVSTFSCAIALAMVYLPLFVPSNRVVLPTLDEILAFFTLCQKEFVRGRAETIAFEAARSFQGIPETVLDDSMTKLVNQFGGSLSDMIKETQYSQLTTKLTKTKIIRKKLRCSIRLIWVHDS